MRLFLELVSLSDSRFSLTFEKREQVGVDDVGLRRDHAVGQSLYVFSVPFFRSLAESGPAA